MTLASGFHERSPHRLSVTLALSAVLDEPADLMGAWRDAAVHLTGAEHRVCRPRAFRRRDGYGQASEG